MAQISFSDLTNGVVPDASDFNDRFNALKNRINNGMEQDNLAAGSVTGAKIVNGSVTALKIDQSGDFAWTGEQDFSGATVTGVPVPTTGLFKNLKAVRASVSTVTVTLDELILDSGTKITSVNETIDITASGASGLDTGSEASSTWYYIWIIRKSSDGTVNGLLSTSASSPSMPSGYDQKSLVSAVRNDGSSNFINFIHEGKQYLYNSWQVMASGTQTAWGTVDTSSFVPSALSTLIVGSLGCDDNYNAVANDNTVTASNITANQFVAPFVAAGRVAIYSWMFNLITANTLYWQGGSANAKLYCAGFVINKL